MKSYTFQHNPTPVAGAGPYSSWHLHPGRFLTTSQVQQLRQSTKARTEAKAWKRARYLEWFVVELALHTGLRVFEIAALHCGDLFLDGELSCVYIRRGKGGKPRAVRIGPDFEATLKGFLAWKQTRAEPTGPEHPLLAKHFISKRTIQDMVSRAYAAAGIRGHRVHDLRHTFACALYRSSNWNLRLVQRQLGHADIRTTQVYADVLDPDLTEAVAQLYKNTDAPRSRCSVEKAVTHGWNP